LCVTAYILLEGRLNYFLRLNIVKVKIYLLFAIIIDAKAEA
jgi:hypothetical protein